MFVLLCTQSIFLSFTSATISVNINSIIQLIWVIFHHVGNLDSIYSIMLHRDFALIERVFYWLTIRCLFPVHTIIILYTWGPTQWVILTITILLYTSFLFRIPNHFLGFMDSFDLALIINNSSLEIRTLRGPMVRIGSLELLATFWMEFVCWNVSVAHHVASPRSTLHNIHFEDWFYCDLGSLLSLLFFLLFINLVIFELLFWSLAALPLSFLETFVFIPNYLVRNIYGILCPRIALLFTYLIILILVASVDTVVVFVFGKILWYTKSIWNTSRDSSGLICLICNWSCTEFTAIRLIFNWICSNICF